MADKPQHSPEHRALLHRWAELMRQDYRTPEELSELEALDAVLTPAELALVDDDVQDALAVHESPFRYIVDDYDFAVGQAGSLGGVELWSEEAMNL